MRWIGRVGPFLWLYYFICLHCTSLSGPVSQALEALMSIRCVSVSVTIAAPCRWRLRVNGSGQNKLAKWKNKSQTKKAALQWNMPWRECAVCASMQFERCLYVQVDAFVCSFVICIYVDVLLRLRMEKYWSIELKSNVSHPSLRYFV